MVVDMGDKSDIKSLQKTAFIFTVNLGHIDKKFDWSTISEEEIIEELEAHWQRLLEMPNLKLARGQIERNEAGVLHINGGIKVKGVLRARTLENRWGCWAEPARNEEAVLNYGKKQDTRVKPLDNFGVMKSRTPKGTNNPKQEALKMLKLGMTPKQICMVAPDVYFTHHRAINETYKMMSMFPLGFEFTGEEE